MSEIERLVADFGKVPKDLARRLRPAIRAAAREVQAESQRRSSWSSRIPGAHRISVRFGARSAGVSVVVSARRAPHARPFEHDGTTGTFWHPVFGDRSPGAKQAARPFLLPAAQAKASSAVGEIDQAVEQVLRRAGWR